MELEDAKEELQLKKLERQQRLKELLGDDDDEEDSMEAMLLATLAPVLLQKFGAGNSPTPKAHIPPHEGIPPSAVNSAQYTDDEIREILQSFDKKHLKLAKKLSNDALKKTVYSHMPGLNPESVDRAVEMLRNEF